MSILDYYMKAQDPTDWVTAYDTITKEGRERASEFMKKAGSTRNAASKFLIDGARIATPGATAIPGMATSTLKRKPESSS